MVTVYPRVVTSSSDCGEPCGAKTQKTIEAHSAGGRSFPSETSEPQPLPPSGKQLVAEWLLPAHIAAPLRQLMKGLLQRILDAFARGGSTL